MSARPLAIGSLFSGIGGLELGLERAGLGPVVWQVEKDAYCRAVLAKHWPDATRYEDVKDVGGRNLAPVDLICGGYPCQPFSFAGHREGQADERHLWPEFARILRELRPRYAVLENVAAHLSLGFGDVLRDLAASGYDAEWSVLSACAVGAAHARERLFIIAYPARQRSVQSAESVQARRVPLQSRGIPGGDRVLRLDQPPVVGSRDGIPSYFHRNHALGNAVVPQVAEVVGRVIQELESQRAEGAA